MRIKILGKDYELVEYGLTDALEGDQRVRGRMGFTEYATQVIGMLHGLHPDQRRDTLVHEALHAISYQLGLDLSEKTVQRLACGLSALVKDNPAIFDDETWEKKKCQIKHVSASTARQDKRGKIRSRSRGVSR
jgi:hypothetical protein